MEVIMNINRTTVKLFSSGIGCFSTILLVCLLLLQTNSLFPQDDKKTKLSELTALSLEELMNIEVVTVSRKTQKIFEAPGLITVITKQDIENSGARTIIDILRFVPGFSSAINQFGLNEIEVRGFRSTNSSSIIFLLNGLSVNNNIFGEATRIFDDMSLNNVKRIEILRGPGSAVYGSNAMLAVINVLTYQAGEIDKLKMDIRYSSFNTIELSGIYGAKLSDDITITTSLNILNTDGPKLFVEEDRISVNSYSLAPRTTDYSNFKIDARLSVAYKDWKFNSLYVNKNRGPNFGPSFALVQRGEFKNRGTYFVADLLRNFIISDKLKLKPRMYYKKMQFSPDGQIFPPGFGFYDEDGIALDINSDGLIDVFPDGMTAKYELNDNLIGLEMINEIDLSKSHNIQAGFITEYSWIDNLKTSANFNIIVPGDPYYLGEFKIFDEGIVDSYDRLSLSFFIQDIWYVSEFASLTTGFHYDYYNDFGSSLNPRIGWVHSLWDKRITYKLLYGHAFRAPSMGELARANNANIIGNPDLKPEKLDSFEAGFTFKLNGFSQFDINIFYIDMKNRINRKSRVDVQDGHAALIYENDDKIISKGIEAQLSIYNVKKFSGYLNFTYQNSKTYPLSGEVFKTPTIPVIKSNLFLNYKWNKNINTNFALNYIGKRIRAENDSRDDVDAYYWGVFTLKLTEIIKSISMSFSLYNLFDDNYVDNGHQVFIPNDYPRPDINFSIKLSYKIN